MCGAPLTTESTESAPSTKTPGSSLSTTVVFSIDPPAKLVCPVCEATNEGDWVFCQQCGSKLKATPIPVAPVESDAAPTEKQTFATTIQASQLAAKPKPAAGITCPKCSEPLIAEAAFCHKCGQAISTARTIAMSSLKPAQKARLLLIVDGEETGEVFEITGDTVVGRVDGDITFPHDDYMSGRHARIAKRGERFVLIDEDSRNGSFMRIKKEADLKPGDFILLGKQLFKFEM
ncbi:MAG TPA: zinc ribbon domain-containing protein [Blastocatellia bacterium]|nr:zinc ribbon domain-containing protein [Blastocatellia bacterium]